jgi:hypothetical protein
MLSRCTAALRDDAQFMVHCLLALLVHQFSMPCCECAPKPKGDSGLYFPVGVNDTWTIEVRSGESVREQSFVVTSVAEKSGVHSVTVYQLRKEKDGELRCFNERVYGISEFGVTWLSRDGIAYDDPLVMLKLPAKPGDTWKSSVTVGDDKYGRTFTVGKEEIVETTAGKFKTIKLDSVTEIGRDRMEVTSWYTLGLGEVKSITKYDGEEIVRVLKSFTLGKDKK